MTSLHRMAYCGNRPTLKSFKKRNKRRSSISNMIKMNIQNRFYRFSNLLAIDYSGVSPEPLKYIALDISNDKLQRYDGWVWSVHNYE